MPISAPSPTNDPLQAPGRQLVNLLHMLARSAKLYEPENAIFAKPLAAVAALLNGLVQSEGKAELHIVGDALYLNGTRIKLEAGLFDGLRQLALELAPRQVSGLTAHQAVALDDLKSLVAVLRSDAHGPCPEDGLPERPFQTLRLVRAGQAKERLSTDPARSDTPVDRQRLARTAYARALVFVRQRRAGAASGKPLPFSSAGRLAQTLVDLSAELPGTLLGLTALRFPDDAEGAAHEVNTALLAVALGGRLALSRAQLKDLALLGLNHTPDPAGSASLDLARQWMADSGASRAAFSRAVLSSEVACLCRGKAPQVALAPSIPNEPAGVLAQIIALACAFDALTTAAPGRPSLTASDALLALPRALGPALSADLARCFEEMLA